MSLLLTMYKSYNYESTEHHYTNSLYIVEKQDTYYEVICFSTKVLRSEMSAEIKMSYITWTQN